MKRKTLWLVISSLVILLPIAAGLILWNELPDYMVTHWGLGGEADGSMARLAAVFAMPLFSLVMHWLSIWLTTRDNKHREQNPKVTGMILWICPLMSLYGQGIILGTAMGLRLDASRLMLVLLGVMFVVFGNYLPKCRMNGTIGVRIPWVYTSEENWAKTHRFTGKLWVILGLLLLPAVFLPEEAVAYCVLIVLVPMAVLPVVYSYRYYKKQVEKGEIPKGFPTKLGKSSKTAAICTVVILVLALIFCAIMMLVGNYEITFGEDTLYIDATLWQDREVSYADIDRVEFREQDVSGSRVMGYGDVRVLMGTFENEEFGTYTRYSHAGSKSGIVLYMKGTVLVLSDEDDAKTQALYEQLLVKTAK